MLEHSALIGFVGVSDLDRARQFYGDTLGLPITEESPFALVANADGTMLRLTPVEQPMAAPYTILGWRVADIASMIDQLTARGVHFTRYEGMGQDERGVWTAPGGAKIAWFPDPDGNNLSLTQFATSE
jgi:catechol 2,3-dioxygenase-like lactoylglutathione lyase family enzyme